MIPAGIAFVLCLSSGAALAQEGRNLLRNGDFEKGLEGWTTSGDSTVQQTLESDAGRGGGKCARLSCTRITGQGPASHVMLAQINHVALRAGKWYRLVLWARQEGLEGDAIRVTVSQTKPWRSGVADPGSFQPVEEWREYEIQFRAVIDVPAEASRFQMWHASTGTLWVDDLALEEIPRPRVVPLTLVEPPPGRNLVPNASFECGAGGWGSVARLRSWGGNLPGLLGEVDSSAAAHGRKSLRIRLAAKDAPVFHFDYFEMYRDPVRAVATVNLGWLRLENGAPYTLSAMMKADRPGLKVRLKVERAGQQDVEVGTAWQRHSMTRKAVDEYGFVGFEVDLEAQKLDEAVLWLDAVQLEKGERATPFEPYAPVEAQVAVGKAGRVFAAGEPVGLNVAAFNNGSSEGNAAVTVTLQDFFDAPAGERKAGLRVPPGAGSTAAVPLGIDRKGFTRATVTVEAGGTKRTHALRIAVVEPYREKDSIFGVNHAYPWDELMDLKRAAGVTWTRDWSLKWRDVEPEKGRFVFGETDAQIDRPIRMGDQVLGLLPFPSSDWSTTLPAGRKSENAYVQKRDRSAAMPRDLGEFEAYVAKCVEHYKGRIRYWEVLNEPLYTTYSVPLSFGCTPKDYVTILRHAYQTIKRVDPEAKVIGGIASPGGELYDQIVKEGALDFMDCLNTHTYPGATAPERTQERMDHLNRLMAGKPRKMWCTEYAYYADDDMPARPMFYEMPFVRSEKLAAAYFVRLSAIMAAAGTEKLFYHAGTSGQANTLSYEGFLVEHAGPRKVYAAISAMANLFRADAKPAGRMETPEGVWAFLFESPRGAFLVAWRAPKESGKIALKDARLKLMDIEGNPLPGTSAALSEYPVYVVGTGLKAEEVRRGIEFGKEMK